MVASLSLPYDSLGLVITLLSAMVVWQGSLMGLLYVLHPNKAGKVARTLAAPVASSSPEDHHHDHHDDDHSSVHSSGASSDGTPEPSEHNLNDATTDDEDVAETLALVELQQNIKNKQQQKGKKSILIAWPIAALSSKKKKNHNSRDLLAVPPQGQEGDAQRQQQTVKVEKHDVSGCYMDQDDGDVCCCF